MVFHLDGRVTMRMYAPQATMISSGMRFLLPSVVAYALIGLAVGQSGDGDVKAQHAPCSVIEWRSFGRNRHSTSGASGASHSAYDSGPAKLSRAQTLAHRE
jgi:hypothetical protein